MRHRALPTDVAAEMGWDPHVDVSRIEVSADQGTITLRGTVASVREKREAVAAARRIYGVTTVIDRLDVHAGPECGREDATVASDVRQALTLNRSVPATVEASVQDGRVTLTGTAVWQCQREEAEVVCANVRGVLAIEDQITLAPVAVTYDMQVAVSSALARSACLVIGELSVDVRDDGTVILSGAVTSWHEHDEALEVAWSAAGVTDVDDRILVAY